MRTKTALKIRLLNAEGKSLRQIAEAVELSADEIEDYLLTAGLTPTYTVKQGRQENPKRKEIRNYMENQRVLGVPMKKRVPMKQRGLTQEQRRQIRAEQTKTQEDKNMNTESTTKSPAPAATGTSEKVENNDKVINNNDTTNSRACQVGGLSMSTGGGKSAMMMKVLDVIADTAISRREDLCVEDQEVFDIGKIYGYAKAAMWAAQETEEK